MNFSISFFLPETPTETENPLFFTNPVRLRDFAVLYIRDAFPHLVQFLRFELNNLIVHPLNFSPSICSMVAVRGSISFF